MEKPAEWVPGPGADGPAANVSERRRADRERVRVEFYATYDVMTGVRIAATLGGFFALMVFLIVYKSRSKSVKALNDPRLVQMAEAAVAEEQAVEEERQLSAAIEEALSERARSRSLAGEPPPPLMVARAARCASYGGGYVSALAPPRRWCGARAGSLPGCALPAGGPRRLSSVTCSSSGSSYLERRGSSVVCALPDRPRRRPPQSSTSRRLAPLASASSARPSLADCELSELASPGADSVFAEPDSTDDEVDQFSTDSGGTELPARPRRLPLCLERASHSRETLF